MASTGHAQRKGLAPAHRPARDGDHMQARVAQVSQRLQRVSRDLALGGQRVINVGEDATDLPRLDAAGQLSSGPMSRRLIGFGITQQASTSGQNG